MNHGIWFPFALACHGCAATVALAFATPTAGPGATTQIVALSGNAAPGGGNYYAFDVPIINRHGQVAFAASLTNIGAGLPAGVYRYDGGATAAIGVPFQAGPQQFQFAGEPTLNNLGVVAFMASSLGSGSTFVMRGAGSSLTEIARVGQAAPGGGTIAYLPIAPGINDSGHVSLPVSFNATSGATGGVYRGSGAALTEIARLGRPTPIGGAFSSFHWAFPINNSGDIAFAAATTTGSGIFCGNGASTVKIAAQGDPAPDGDGVFANLEARTPVLNNSGQVAFFGGVDPVVGTRYGGVFRGSGGEVTQIARGDQATPGGDGIFNSFSYGPAINDHGQAAFVASLKGFADPNQRLRALYRGDGTTLVEAVREGAFAPDGNGRFVDFGSPELNGRGHMALVAKLSDTLRGVIDDEGIYFYSDRTGLVQVARKGQHLLGSMILSLNFTGGLNHVGSIGDEAAGINDVGQLAYSFSLTDGRRGIAVWRIPEPAAAAMLLTGLAICGALRRRLSA